jgi:hypothetical protein
MPMSLIRIVHLRVHLVSAAPLPLPSSREGKKPAGKRKCLEIRKLSVHRVHLCSLETTYLEET